MIASIPDGGLSDGVVKLRHWTTEDADFIYQACQDDEIQRWTVVPSPYSRQDALDYLEALEASKTFVSAGIVAADTGERWGDVGLGVNRDDAVGSVGYWMTPDARGRGAAPRAVRLLTAWAIETFGLARVELFTDEDNTPSRRVAEKAGFHFEGVLRSYREIKGRRIDAAMYSLLPDDLTG